MGITRIRLLHMEKLAQGFSILNDEQQDQAHSNTKSQDHLFCEEEDYLDSSLISVEEPKIWDELETQIEKDLEEEIKDGIYQLALRLHGLYQHKKARKKPFSSINNVGLPSKSNNCLFTEVNINIRIEGECKIKVKERKTNALHMSRPQSSKSEAKQGKLSYAPQDFDWRRSLRCGRCLLFTSGKKCGASHKAFKDKKHASCNVWH